MWVFIIIIVVILVVVWVNSNTSNRVQGNSSKQKFPTVDESQLNDDLSSAVGIDYRTLRNFLAVGDFESANKETIVIFTQLIYSRNKEIGTIGTAFYVKIDDDELYPQRVERIPCTDICTIERLWVKYSSGHFGFSIQYKIDRHLYKQFSDNIIEFNRKEKVNMIVEEIHIRAFLKNYEAFKEQIKWTDQRVLIFNRSAPTGHLPKILWVDDLRSYNHLILLFYRVTDCIDS